MHRIVAKHIVAERQIDLVALGGAGMVPEFLRKHNLTFWPDMASHTHEYHLSSAIRLPKEKSCEGFQRLPGPDSTSLLRGHREDNSPWGAHPIGLTT